MSLNLSTEMVFWIVIVVAVLAIANLSWLFFIHQKIKRLLGGDAKAESIENGMGMIRADLDTLIDFRRELEMYLESVEIRLKRSVQGVETIRFNPFKGNGDGGNQSFSTAFVDENGNGVVVSSLYSRDRVSIFSKAVKNFTSEFELTDEEKTVIHNAKQKISK